MVLTNTVSADLSPSSSNLSPRKKAVRDLFDRLAPEREQWISRNRYFYDQDHAYMRFLIPRGLRVLELGCGTGHLLEVLEPSYGLGIDLSPEMVHHARARHPSLEFIEGDIEDPDLFQRLAQPFDVVVLSDTIGLVDDCQQILENLHCICTLRTRIVIAYYSHAWEPILGMAEKLGLKMPQVEQNWLSTEDIMALLQLADFEPIKREWRTMIPRRALGVGSIVNRFVAPLPFLRRLCLRNYVVARPCRNPALGRPSATVLIPCRNERGNVEAAARRVPDFCPDLEILFVEGHSRDGTLEEIRRVIAANPERNIRVLQQPGKGKGDAVRFGFANAGGDILMILDGDLTVPPEALPKFYEALVSGKGEFINGTRLVYSMEGGAMRFLNEVANHVFSRIFTWLLNQRITDTLCGTKVITRASYDRIAASRSYFGDFDPFGDFDLILGAAKLNLRMLEVPIRYAARTYGETQISPISPWMAPVANGRVRLPQTEGDVMKERLSEHLAIWERKTILRAIYEDCYHRIVAQCVPGLTLELGGGTGNLKHFRKDIITSDIQWAHWMDMIADAQQLPLKDASLGNIVMFDVLHHLERPALFLGEAQRVLRSGGRLIICEPAITALSGFFYRHFHPEPVDMKASPLEEGEITKGRDPYSANQAIPTLLFTRHRRELEARFQGLRILQTEFFGLIAYPLSGGFRSWSFVPKVVAQRLLQCEAMVPCWLKNLGAFRLLGVIEHS